MEINKKNIWFKVLRYVLALVIAFLFLAIAINTWFVNQEVEKITQELKNYKIEEKTIKEGLYNLLSKERYVIDANSLTFLVFFLSIILIVLQFYFIRKYMLIDKRYKSILNKHKKDITSLKIKLLLQYHFQSIYLLCNSLLIYNVDDKDFTLNIVYKIERELRDFLDNETSIYNKKSLNTLDKQSRENILNYIKYSGDIIKQAKEEIERKGKEDNIETILFLDNVENKLVESKTIIQEKKIVEIKKNSGGYKKPRFLNLIGECSK